MWSSRWPPCSRGPCSPRSPTGSWTCSSPGSIPRPSRGSPSSFASPARRPRDATLTRTPLPGQPSLNTQNLSTAERLALLELLQATAPRQAAPKLSPIEPVDRSAPLPLSLAQLRLWFLDQYGIPGAAYNIPLSLPLRGELDRSALVRALDRIVARHEALRTTFAAVGGEPVQRIAPAEDSPFRLAEHDLRGHPEARAELGRLITEEAAAPFDL